MTKLVESLKDQAPTTLAACSGTNSTHGVWLCCKSLQAPPLHGEDKEEIAEIEAPGLFT